MKVLSVRAGLFGLAGAVAVLQACSGGSSCPADASAGSSGMAGAAGHDASTDAGGSGGAGGANAPLNAANLNLIFVVSDDLAYQAPGDVDPNTANLTNQGLQRSLLLGSYLQSQVLGMKNVTGIYALQPMSHLQTASNYPDIVGLQNIQQFALLNEITLAYAVDGGVIPFAGNSYPLSTSYAPDATPDGVAPPISGAYCVQCQGVDFNDVGGDNEALAGSIINANAPGFHVFSAPWETTSALLAKINTLRGYGLNIPANYAGPNLIYAISIPPSGSPSLVTFNSNISPPTTYPGLPPLDTAACGAQPAFSVTITGGSDGAVIPSGINTNETVYFVRHAEAHPGLFDDGNYVCEGQWRALALPTVLPGQLAPDALPNLVYSIDPAQIILGLTSASGQSLWSYVRPTLTVEPYAIANALPYNLAASFQIFAQNAPVLGTDASNFFFAQGKFSNQKVLVAWEHGHIPPLANALIASYFAGGVVPAEKQAPSSWPSTDFDTIWTVTLDGSGNLTVDNSKCEGIKSQALPAECPQF